MYGIELIHHAHKAFRWIGNHAIRIDYQDAVRLVQLGREREVSA